MDRHFRFAEPARQRRRCSPPSPTGSMSSSCGCQTRGVFAYDERLRLLPFYLQQLEMESNGKSVTTDGKPVEQPTAPVTWGGAGTDAQHAVFQLLHQGTRARPGRVRRGDRGRRRPGSRASPPAAAQCLRAGRGADGRAGRATIRSAPIPATGRATTILLDRLDPRSLGALIAFYEHRTFANAVLLGINPFDQFGVELGKEIARKLADGGDERRARSLDPRADRKGRSLMADFDLFVIGAGSGGVRAARVAAAYGARVAIAEEYKVGGTCVIRGCVPKKLLVYGAHFAEDLDDAAMFGWDVPTKRFDWPVLRDNVLAEVGRLEGAYTDTLTNHDVEIFHERAELTGPNSVRLASGKEVTADKILIATGARPVMPEIDGHRACDQLERGVPPRRAAEAHRDRRRRLYRQ